tara:strand:- start:207 stop:386 length:180 start_codon:yes stop_codon:yes gene_type:complete
MLERKTSISSTTLRTGFTLQLEIQLKRKASLVRKAFGAKDRVPFDFAQDRLLTLKANFK